MVQDDTPDGRGDAGTANEGPPPRAIVESWPGWPGMRLSLTILAIVAGVVVAIPILAVLKICADHVERMSALGEFLSHD